MAEFTSKYSELGFYVDGSLRNFRGGRYITEDKAEIESLRKLTDVTEIKLEKSEPKAEVKPKAKAATKPSGK